MSNPDYIDLIEPSQPLPSGSMVIEHNDKGGVLRRALSNAYKYPEQAIIREYIANALDAQQANGSTLPVEVHIPTLTDPELRVADHGCGMDLDTVVSAFVHYNVSTKRNDPNATGQLGIGAKSGLALSDTIDVTTVKNGMLTHVILHAGLSDMEYTVLDHSAVDLPDGTTVRVPIRLTSDNKTANVAVINNWEKAWFVMSIWFTGYPIVSNITHSSRAISNGSVTMIIVPENDSNYNYYFVRNTDDNSNGNRIRVRMGSITYPMPFEIAKPKFASILERCNEHRRFIIDLPKSLVNDPTSPGVDLSFDREGLLKTPRTMSYLTEHAPDWLKAMETMLLEPVADAPSAYRAACRIAAHSDPRTLRAQAPYDSIAPIQARHPMFLHDQPLFFQLSFTNCPAIQAQYLVCERQYQGDLYLTETDDVIIPEIPRTIVVTGVTEEQITSARSYVRTWALPMANLTKSDHIVFVTEPQGEFSWLRWGMDDSMRTYTLDEIVQEVRQWRRDHRKEKPVTPVMPDKYATNQDDRPFMTLDEIHQYDGMISIVQRENRATKYAPWLVIYATKKQAEQLSADIKITPFPTSISMAADAVAHNKLREEVLDESLIRWITRYGDLSDIASEWKKVRDPELRKALRAYHQGGFGAYVAWANNHFDMNYTNRGWGSIYTALAQAGKIHANDKSVSEKIENRYGYIGMNLKTNKKIVVVNALYSAERQAAKKTAKEA